MADPEPELIATVSAQATSRLAHHEAGHAVAAVARGGFVDRVHLGHVDWSTNDASGDEPGETHHWTSPVNAPFVTFAGPWATAMWMVEHDPDVDDVDEALEYAWNDSSDGDSEKYEARVDALVDAAAALGFPIGRLHHSWEYGWAEELEALWPAVCDVAALLIDGQAVTHADVAAAIAKTDPDD